MSQIVSRIEELFQQHFGQPDLIVRSPGRINLIGEHTDYNYGFVLPAAIDKAIYIAIRKREDQTIRLFAGDLLQSYQTELSSLHPAKEQWPDFIIGVTDQLINSGYQLSGFDAVVMGDVPLGAGLSSSAAVECATAFALNEIFDLKLERLQMVQTAQRSENEFVGVKCGIMDPFASMFGKKGNVIRLDCRSLEYAYMPFDYADKAIVLFDTGVKHSLASSEYNLRRQECEKGVSIIQQQYPKVQSLRDATEAMVEECLGSGDPVIFKRCSFMVSEIKRLQDACEDLVKHDLHAFGQKMYATHDGLSKLYAVSCAEADALVDYVRDNKSVYGARMMGGGFGGCTINIVQKEKLEDLIHEVTEKYRQQFDRTLKTYVVSIDDGTSIVS